MGIMQWRRNPTGHSRPLHFLDRKPVRQVSLSLSTLQGDQNLGSEMARYEANANFQRDYYKRRKLVGRSPGNDDKVSIMFST